MTLLAQQTAFREEIIAADDGTMPSSTGMAIYRDAYRGRLLSALETSFERTRRWTGEEAFAAAACHYIITNPPRSWTLDDYGAELPALLASLFPEDPEVAELGWLEWQMSQAFVAPDKPTLDVSSLAASCQTDADWDNLRLDMASGFALRIVSTNCYELWENLVEPASATIAAKRMDAMGLMVWRCGLQPHWRLLSVHEADAIGIFMRGGTLGDLTKLTTADQLGIWLAQWFSDGIFAAK